MTERQRRWVLWGLVAALAAGAAYDAHRRMAGAPAADGLARGNGRLEAVEIDVAAEAPGKLKSVLAREGDFVVAGQVVAEMDDEVLQAQRRQAEAELKRAQGAAATARAEEKRRAAELFAAKRRSERTSKLAQQGDVSQQEMEDDRARYLSSDAALAAARAQVQSASAAAEAAQAVLDRVGRELEHARLKAPRDGRVQYRIAEPGEVLAPGGRVLNMLDLSDVYMTFFLPTAQAGRLALGDEARLVLDAVPQYVIPAKISFVSSEAQFTPKTVETESEREKLMFRVRAAVPVEILRKHIVRVKTGLPGTAYVRLDSRREWPARLQARLPP